MVRYATPPRVSENEVEVAGAWVTPPRGDRGGTGGGTRPRPEWGRSCSTAGRLTGVEGVPLPSTDAAATPTLTPAPAATAPPAANPAPAAEGAVVVVVLVEMMAAPEPPGATDKEAATSPLSPPVRSSPLPPANTVHHTHDHTPPTSSCFCILHITQGNSMKQEETEKYTS